MEARAGFGPPTQGSDDFIVAQSLLSLGSLASKLSEIQLLEKRRGSKGMWGAVQSGAGLRVTQGKGKNLRLQFRSTVEIPASAVEVLLLVEGTERVRAVADDQRGFSIETSSCLMRHGTQLLEYDLKLFRLSRQLQFVIQIRDPVSGRVFEMCTNPFYSHNNGRHSMGKFEPLPSVDEVRVHDPFSGLSDPEPPRTMLQQFRGPSPPLPGSIGLSTVDSSVSGGTGGSGGSGGGAGSRLYEVPTPLRPTPRNPMALSSILDGPPPAAGWGPDAVGTGANFGPASRAMSNGDGYHPHQHHQHHQHHLSSNVPYLQQQQQQQHHHQQHLQHLQQQQQQQQSMPGDVSSAAPQSRLLVDAAAAEYAAPPTAGDKRRRHRYATEAPVDAYGRPAVTSGGSGSGGNKPINASPPLPPSATGSSSPASSYRTQYSGLDWLDNLEPYRDDPQLPLEVRYKRLKTHYVSQSNFLIERVRTLSELLDQQQQQLHHHQQQQRQPPQQQQQQQQQQP